MEDLFGIVVMIIGGIIAGMYSDKKKKDGKQKKKAVPNMSGGRKNVPQSQTSYGSQRNGQVTPADAAVTMQMELSAKQRELKQRLQQKYGTAQNSQAKRTQTNSGRVDILSQADSNVKENQRDELREQFYEKSGKPQMKVHGECEDECSLMDEVNDLMIMGYQTNLSFERDFVAEGVEMLNRFEIPDEIAELTEIHIA